MDVRLAAENLLEAISLEGVLLEINDDLLRDILKYSGKLNHDNASS